MRESFGCVNLVQVLLRFDNLVRSSGKIVVRGHSVHVSVNNAGVQLVLIVAFVPETYHPVLLVRSSPETQVIISLADTSSSSGTRQSGYGKKPAMRNG